MVKKIMLRDELVKEAKEDGFNTNNDNVLLLYGILKKFKSKDLIKRYKRVKKFCPIFGLIGIILLFISINWKESFGILCNFGIFFLTLSAILYGIRNNLEMSVHDIK